MGVSCSDRQQLMSCRDLYSYVICTVRLYTHTRTYMYILYVQVLDGSLVATDTVGVL